RPSQESRKISGPLVARRHGAYESSGCRLPQAFVVRKEVGLVFPNRPADCAAKLIAVERRLFSVVEKVSRVRITVAVKLVSIPVESISTRFRHNVDDVPAAPSILRCKSVGLNLELLHVVHGGNIDHPTPIEPGVISSIDQIGCRVKKGAAEIEERNILIGTSRNTRSSHNLLLRRVADRGVQFRQANYVAQA